MKRKIRSTKAMRGNRPRELKQGPLLNVAKSFGKWQPHDDYLLIKSVQHLSRLDAIHKSTKFSTKFSLKEIQERWFVILYDEPISNIIMSRIRKISVHELTCLNAKIPFSDRENEILMKIKSNVDTTWYEFEVILRENRNEFHKTRTARQLHTQWLILKQFKLLEDQQELSSDIREDTFEEKERLLNDDEIQQTIELSNEKEEELNLNYKKLLSEIKLAENELYLWQVLVDQVTNDKNPFEDNECLGLIEGKNLKYIIKSREVSFGRSTHSSTVDLDLSDSVYDAKMISRKHGFIRMNENGTFFLFNNSTKPIFVDGKIILKESSTQLFDKSIIQVYFFHSK